METRCVVNGKPECEFVAKPINNWDKKNPLYKSQKIDKIVTLKEIGAKKEAYSIGR